MIQNHLQSLPEANKIYGLFWRDLLIAGIFSLALCTTGCQQKQNGSPESEAAAEIENLNAKSQPPSEWDALNEKFKQVREGMSEAEVDAIFQGFRAYPKGKERRIAACTGDKLFSRPSTFSKTYVKSSKEEGEHFVRIYLDESSYVLGMEISTFCR
jgi:hypothetical protein